MQANGQRRSATAATRAEAQRRGAELLLELGQVPSPRSGVTVGELIEQHVATLPPSPADAARLFAAADEMYGPRFGAHVRLAATTGARQGEPCGLRRSDLDLVASRMTITRAASAVPGRASLSRRPRLGRRGTPSVALGVLAVTALDRLAEFEVDERTRTMHEPRPWVFTHNYELLW